MNTKFNFLVQFMLVALLFSVVTVPVSGQFGDGNNGVGNSGKVGIVEEDLCMIEGDKLSATLLLDIPNYLFVDGIVDIESLDFGCDLFVGLTSTVTNQTSYMSINSLQHNVNVGAFEYDYVEPQSHSHSAAQFDMEIPLPSLETNCSKGQLNGGSEDQLFFLDLYCLSENNYESVDPCQYEDFFYLNLLEVECSLRTKLTVSLCCELDFNEYGYSEQDGGEEVNVKFEQRMGENDLNVRSEEENDYKADYMIINLNGQTMKKGHVNISFNELVIVDLNELPTGIYISIFKDSFGGLMIKRIIKY